MDCAGKARLQALIIPGNPGGAGYYVPFMQHFFEAMDGEIDVIAVSHLGHDGLGEPHNQVKQGTLPSTSAGHGHAADNMHDGRLDLVHAGV